MAYTTTWSFIIFVLVLDRHTAWHVQVHWVWRVLGIVWLGLLLSSLGAADEMRLRYGLLPGSENGG